MIVKGIYEINIIDDESKSYADMIEEAKKEFDYSIQDKEIHSSNLKWEIDGVDLERKKELFKNLKSYVFEHNEEPEDYARALKQIGFTKNEVLEQLTYDCGFDVDDMQDLVDEIYPTITSKTEVEQNTKETPKESYKLVYQHKTFNNDWLEKEIVYTDKQQYEKNIRFILDNPSEYKLVSKVDIDYPEPTRLKDITLVFSDIKYFELNNGYTTRRQSQDSLKKAIKVTGSDYAKVLGLDENMVIEDLDKFTEYDIENYLAETYIEKTTGWGLQDLNYDIFPKIDHPEKEETVIYKVAYIDGTTEMFIKDSILASCRAEAVDKIFDKRNAAPHSQLVYVGVDNEKTEKMIIPRNGKSIF